MMQDTYMHIANPFTIPSIFDFWGQTVAWCHPRLNQSPRLSQGEADAIKKQIRTSSTMQLISLKMAGFKSTYLLTILQLYVLDNGALFLEYLHCLSQRHTYLWSKKYDQFERESRWDFDENYVEKLTKNELPLSTAQCSLRNDFQI